MAFNNKRAPRTTPLLMKYTQAWEKNPQSRIFAPLAETLRKLGRANEGLKVCQRGLTHHPNYGNGLLVMAQCFWDLNQYQRAYDLLAPVVDRHRDNILMQKFFAKVCEELNKTQLALEKYKYLLFLNAKDSEIQKKVKSIEEELALSGKLYSQAGKGKDSLNKNKNALQGGDKSFSSINDIKEALVAKERDHWTRVDFTQRAISEPQTAVFSQDEHEGRNEELEANSQSFKGKGPENLPSLPPVGTSEVPTVPETERIQESESQPSLNERLNQSLEEVHFQDFPPLEEEELNSRGPGHHGVAEELEAPTQEKVVLSQSNVQRVGKSGQSEKEDRREGPRHPLGVDSSTHLVSHTLVDLYLAQGHHQQALSVLQKMKEINPEDDRILSRLKQLKGAVSPALPIVDTLVETKIQQAYLIFLKELKGRAARRSQ